MGITVYSFLWGMQDFGHQQYVGKEPRETLNPKPCPLIKEYPRAET